MTRLGALVAVLALVGVPAGVAVVAHETAPQRHLSPKGAVAHQLIAKLQREGATNITCAWTGSGQVAAVSCSGTVGGSKSAGVDAYEIGTSSK